jgi:serine/threonine-protein kinase
MGAPLRVFISYSRKDAALKDKLLEQLSVLERFRGVVVWTDADIEPGEMWREAIDNAMATTDVALLLVSPSSLASGFINDTEIPGLLRWHGDEGLIVIPVILRDCHWQEHPAIEPFQVLPKGADPIAKHTGHRRDTALKQVAGAIAALAKKRSSMSPPVTSDHPTSQLTSGRAVSTKASKASKASKALKMRSLARASEPRPLRPPPDNFAELEAVEGPPSGIASPTPIYPDARTRTLSRQLEAAQRRKKSLAGLGASTAEVDREILDLRRQIRAGGQLRAGDSFADCRYLLLERIGCGGFATVWKAHDRQTGQLVAIKVLHGEFGGDLVRRERFFRGARIMADLDHDAVVRVIERRGEDEGWHYFVMEYVEGGDLRQGVLASSLRGEAAIPVILRVGEALAKAHERGLIHRDIKPANILLDAAGKPKLTDFDLVGAADTTGGTRTGALGTYLYAAPELMHNAKEGDARADVYGLGMTTIFALKGAEPGIAALRSPDAFIDALECKPAVKEVLKKAVALEPASRFKDAKDFCVALADARDQVEPPLANDRHKAEGRATPIRSLPLTILFLGANPSDTARLELDQEVRGIVEGLHSSEWGAGFRFSQEWAVRARDVLKLVNRHKPTIVHLSCHGTRQGEILLEGEDRRAEPVAGTTLAETFRLAASPNGPLRCVVLNTISSEAAAKAIAEHVDVVVGTTDTVSDGAAVTFSGAFYQALGHGSDLQTAFEIGCNQVRLAGLPDADAYTLILRTGVDARSIWFAGEGRPGTAAPTASPTPADSRPT